MVASARCRHVWRGDLGYVVVGTHRRVPRREVERFTGDRLTRGQEKSLWLHRALLGELLADPDRVLNQARDDLRRWAATQRADGRAVRYLQEWERVLDRGLDEVLETLTGTSARCCELRQNSPFAGVLSGPARARILRSFEDHWTREHEKVVAG